MKLRQLSVLTILIACVCAFSTIGYADDAAALYKSKCQACHGADGVGGTAIGKKLGAKDFHAPDVAKLSDDELFDVTKKGKNKMPAYDKKLSDDQIKDLVKYIHTLK